MTAIGLELLLRLAPGAIPLKLLRFFDDDLRISIAQRRGLATRVAVREVVRDDGGPPLYINLPGVELPIGGDKINATTRMDARGFCSLPDDPPFDIVTVGGSVTWCTGIPAADTWTARVGKQANLKASNMAVPGVGPYEYLQIVKQFAVPTHPRLVFFDFSEANDLRDVVAYERYRSDHLEAETADGGQAVVHSSDNAGFLARHSYLVALIRAELIRLQAHNGSRLFKSPGLPDKEKFDFRYKAKFGDRIVAVNPENGDVDEPLTAFAWQHGLVRFDVLRRPLQELVALGKQHGFTPVLTYTPAAYTVYRKFIEFPDPALGPLLAEFDEAQRNYVMATCSEIGLACVDLATPWKPPPRSCRTAT